MEANHKPTRLTSTYLDCNALLEQMIRLHNQIVDCDSKLVDLALSKQYRLSPENVRALRDEIFGCRIEIQSLRVLMSRLKAKNSTTS